MNIDYGQQKRAELVSTVGAGVLGFGLGALLFRYSAPYAWAITALGIAMHGSGMLLRHRFDDPAARPTPRWIQWLYWLCWVALALLAAFIVARPR